MSQIPGNWSESTSFLATISQPVETNLSTIVPEITDGRNSTFTLAVMDLNRTTINVKHSVASGPSALILSGINQSILYEYNGKIQQDQCWETYVGQVRFNTDKSMCTCLEPNTESSIIGPTLLQCWQKYCTDRVSNNYSKQAPGLQFATWDNSILTVAVCCCLLC